MLLLKEILDPKYGMFTHYQETRAIWFSELSLEEQGMYFLIGQLKLSVCTRVRTCSLIFVNFQGYYVVWLFIISQSSICPSR